MSAAVIPSSELIVGASRTMRFEGAHYDSGVSFFYVDNDPGMGPGLHRHPYTETWLVIEGEATIRMGDDTVVAHAGDTAVVAPDMWHAFTNTGSGRLRIMCIHASPVMIQEESEA
ncbi:cupin domain-containing protein [Microbacterium sp. CFBP9034]|uniref:cupin domain-containing protein n=1 Tax=Microbacterium sp. CFBP9034 TaxID=3096540 RepID=UPI002A6B4773|nr:cupin domain-containing protein [Microbacterium sp. CFBP9034]MDY0909367.1 cupin domain-containing protein [Microbacterium sp. CFBP9034]